MNIYEICKEKLFAIYDITFTYTTRRNNTKTQTVRIKELSTDRAQDEFWQYMRVKNDNKNKEYSNVSILDIKLIDTLKLVV